MSFDKLVTLKTFDNPVQAHILKGRLESDGIESYIFDENIVILNPLYNNLIGGIKLKIRESDLPEATAIIEDIENTPYQSEEEITIHCPYCHSGNIEGNYKSFKGVKGFFSALISFLTFTYPLYYQAAYRCNNCQKLFERES
jgi:hypothetical protein